MLLGYVGYVVATLARRAGPVGDMPEPLHIVRWRRGEPHPVLVARPARDRCRHPDSRVAALRRRTRPDGVGVARRRARARARDRADRDRAPGDTQQRALGAQQRRHARLRQRRGIGDISVVRARHHRRGVHDVEPQLWRSHQRGAHHRDRGVPARRCSGADRRAADSSCSRCCPGSSTSPRRSSRVDVSRSERRTICAFMDVHSTESVEEYATAVLPFLEAESMRAQRAAHRASTACARHPVRTARRPASGGSPTMRGGRRRRELDAAVSAAGVVAAAEAAPGRRRFDDRACSLARHQTARRQRPGAIGARSRSGVDRVNGRHHRARAAHPAQRARAPRRGSRPARHEPVTRRSRTCRCSPSGSSRSAPRST